MDRFRSSSSLQAASCLVIFEGDGSSSASLWTGTVGDELDGFVLGSSVSFGEFGVALDPELPLARCFSAKCFSAKAG